VRENTRKKIIEQGYKSIRQFAIQNKISYAYLNSFLNKERRYNENFVNKIAKALKTPLYELLSDKPLIPYEDKEPILKFNMPEAEFEGIKLFENPVSLGPEYDLSEMVPRDYIPIPKTLPPKGYKSDKDRIVAFPAEGVSMKPIINDGSIVWIDRLDVIPKEGEIYVFYLLNSNNVTIKRLI